jgi:pyroglutamyl-peptidase
VLLTCFEPFGGEEVNSSLKTLELLRGRRIPGVELETLVLPTEFGRAPGILEEGILATGPNVVVCLGQARGRAGITPERVAINVRDARRFPDNAGEEPRDEPALKGGPVAYWSSLPVREIVEALKEAGIPASISNTAGTFVCNHVFYRLVHLISTERNGISGGLIHLPILPEQAVSGEVPSMALEDLARGVELAVTVAARATATAAR